MFTLLAHGHLYPFPSLGIARAIAEGICQRSDLFIQTKFTSVDGQDRNNIPYDPRAALEDQGMSTKPSFSTQAREASGGFPISQISSLSFPLLQ